LSFFFNLYVATSQFLFTIGNLRFVILWSHIGVCEFTTRNLENCYVLLLNDNSLIYKIKNLLI